ncbi:MAG: ImmA/IrrE family metallo-endopeptidase [Solirubrobacteraceae bacterium]
MRWGFKTEARQIATEVRTELGLEPLDRLDAYRLAAHLDIPLVAASSLEPAAPEAVRHVCGADTRAFSAAVILLGSRRVVLYNDAHAPTRQQSDLCHELAHALLLHASSEPLVIAATYDTEQEAEAAWLGAALLVTDEACLDTCRRGQDVGEAALQFGVSPDLMRWRINSTGAQRRIARSRAAQGQSAYP